jgi:hypothetical protein
MPNQTRYKTRHQLAESVRAREEADRSSSDDTHNLANQQSIPEQNDLDAIESTDDAQSITDDTYTATTPNGTPMPERDGLATSTLVKLPQELLHSVNKLLMQHVRKVVVVPRVMTRKHILAPLESPDEPMLVLTTNSPLARTSTRMYNEYASALRTQILSLQVPRLELHVLDFDFSPVTRELLSHFNATHRKFFNTSPNTITVRLTITKTFTNLPDEGGFRRWLEWRASEESADRKINVKYEIVCCKSIKTANDMEALRFWLLLFDPFSDSDGEVGDIMKVMLGFFKAFEAKRAFAALS